MNVPDSFLEFGIRGLANAGEKGWFEGHFGAALLAAYYMDREHDLPGHVRQGLLRNCEAYIEKYPDLFQPLPEEEANASYMNRILDGIEANLVALRSSGHGVILGVLALKALKEHPSLCTPTVAEGIYRTTMYAVTDRKNRYYGIEDYTAVTEEQIFGIPAYQNVNDLIEVCLAELQIVAPSKKIGDVFYHFTGELEHGVTFAHALVELNDMGYTELFAKGLSLHRLQMFLHRQRPEDLLHEAVTHPQFTSILDKSYWEKLYNDPHSIKVPYSALNLIRRLSSGKQAKAEFNVCKILVQNK